MRALVLTDLVNRQVVGMLQSRGALRFDKELLHAFHDGGLSIRQSSPDCCRGGVTSNEGAVVRKGLYVNEAEILLDGQRCPFLASNRIPETHEPRETR